MRIRFKINVSEIELLKRLYFQRMKMPLGKLPVRRISNEIKDSIFQLVVQNNGVIDGERLKKQIFPTNFVQPYNVFISHSHNDIDNAKILAKFLSEAGFNPFLDSYVWGSADDLITEINNKYCKNSTGGYKYRDVLFVTSHIHSILSMAIMETISAVDMFLFIESAESVNLKGVNKRTLSPWLYQEINFAQILPIDKKIMARKEFSAINESVRMSHKLNLTNFIPLNAKNLMDLLQS